ncbi:endolytic transglycosylase MltG [Streptomyces sp. NBC_00670]|uniref:endolytic transglycosylase MltG n=1 Tax=Streptomyces sp. NBC_00670 TaxID=2975804 RepID=UPI002E3299E5|nr:endolytic transglycosylase MltG [Streptomyces sp. NBC_00670]
MPTHIPPWKTRSTVRLTRRGRAALVATGAVLAAAAVAVPLLTLGGGDREHRPRTLLIPEGRRASQVYTAVDKALGLPAGSTAKSVPKADLRLPAEAHGNPEGYLFPATYPIDDRTTPRSLLRFMVDTAHDKFDGGPSTAGARPTASTAYRTVTVASIVQAEADRKADMGKVARVVLNRLQRGMPLQMDSTLNYALHRFAPVVSTADTKIDSPYNSYRRMGLPPTPISNPGEDALRAALHPTPGNWLYFVTVKPGDTRFTASYEEHRRNVADLNRLRASGTPSSTAPH